MHDSMTHDVWMAAFLRVLNDIWGVRVDFRWSAPMLEVSCDEFSTLMDVADLFLEASGSKECLDVLERVADRVLDVFSRASTDPWIQPAQPPIAAHAWVKDQSLCLSYQDARGELARACAQL
jgi:hypothetical protein